MAQRKFHILHGKTKQQRDALMKDVSLALLHGNAAGFHDYEENPSRRKRLEATANPSHPDLAGPKGKRKWPSGASRRKDKKWSPVGVVLEGERLEITPGGRIKTGPGKARFVGTENIVITADGNLMTEVDPNDPLFGHPQKDGAKGYTTSASGDESKEKVVAQKGAPESMSGSYSIKSEPTPPKTVSARGGLDGGKGSVVSASKPARHVKEEKAAREPDIIDWLAEGIGSFADSVGSFKRVKPGPLGPATKDTIVNFDALATMKSLRPEEAARIGYQLGVVRGIDTCGIRHRRERQAIKAEAAYKLQRAITTLEKKITGEQ